MATVIPISIRLSLILELGWVVTTHIHKFATSMASPYTTSRLISLVRFIIRLRCTHYRTAPDCTRNLLLMHRTSSTINSCMEPCIITRPSRVTCCKTIHLMRGLVTTMQQAAFRPLVHFPALLELEPSTTQCLWALPSMTLTNVPTSPMVCKVNSSSIKPVALLLDLRFRDICPLDYGLCLMP